MSDLFNALKSGKKMVGQAAMLKQQNDSQRQFGTVGGVLIPNITMMFGVILFLRLGVITAHAGISSMLLAIGLSLVIMTLTSLSIGSLVTNMKMGSGGIYYIISRVLGIEVGGAVGFGLYFAQLISIALTVSGFAISLHEIVPKLSITAIEMITLLLLAIISGFSARWALKLQGLILGLLIAAIISIFLGSKSSLEPIKDAVPFYATKTLTFWQAFALFYPAMTGIEAGMALSGSLKDPARSLFYGNLWSLIFVAFVYAALSVFAAINVPHANLISDPFAMVEYSSFPPLVSVAIWGATLSSALGCLLGAPRMLQSMASDGVISSVLAKMTAGHEPRRALLLTTILSAIVLFFSTIDQIIPMLAMICLVSYGLLNSVTAFSQLMNAPSWRPSLRTPWWASLSGVAIIFVSMMMIAPGWSIITALLLVLAYIVIRARDVESGFQDLRESFIFFLSRLTLYRLGRPTEHALTWHPQLLVLLGAPTTAAKLIRITHNLTRRSGILTFATVIPEEWHSQERLQAKRAALVNYFERLRIACLCEVYPAKNANEGYIQLIKAFGIGAIQPNTVAVEITDEVDADIVEIIETCKLMQKNLILMHDAKSISESFLIRRGLGRRKRIDIWWNPEDTRAFDLTMSLVTTLTDSLSFSNSTVTIKAQVGDSHAKEEVTRYLNDYLLKSRLDGQVKVYDKEILPEKTGHLSFLHLPSLPKDLEKEDRKKYLLSYLRTLKDELKPSRKDQVCLFVGCYDSIDHRAIYFPKVPDVGERPIAQDEES